MLNSPFQEINQMYDIIEEQVRIRLLSTKKELVVKQLIPILTTDYKKLVKEDVEINVLTFIRDLAFDFHYTVLPSTAIIRQEYWSIHTIDIDYSEDSDSGIMQSILRNYNLKYEEEEADEDEIFDWMCIWQQENYHVEQEFFSECWIEAKKITNANFKAILFEHESWSSSYDLDTKETMDEEVYPAYLEKQGFKLKYYH